MTEVPFTALQDQKVAVIGAGTGQASILGAVRGYAQSLTAIVSVTDTGGHSGDLRELHGIPQVGDGRNCIQALAPNTTEASAFAVRFRDGNEAGISVGNLLIADHILSLGGIGAAFETVARDLGCLGKVLPATEANVNVVAELTDGSVVTGEWNIIQRVPRIPIAQMRLSNDAGAYPPAIEAIRSADVIIIAPGSLHTGIISALLPKGIKDAVRDSRAKVIMLCNMMTQPGLTDGWNAGNHVSMLPPYLGRLPDVVIVNTGAVPENVLDRYRSIGAEPVAPTLGESGNFAAVFSDLIPQNISLSEGERPGSQLKSPHWLTHCPVKLREALTLALS